jgi:hypothetical protein
VRVQVRATVVAPAAFVTFVLGCSPWTVASAAEVYVQPGAEVHAEVDSNRNLATSGKTTSEGYAANVGGVWGVATPLSDTTLRPQLGYVDYPKDHEHSLLGSLDLASTYNSQRSGFSLYGTLNRSDTYISELASAQFNPIIPVSPTTPETARVTTNTTRTLGNVIPKYEYQIAPRMRIGASGVYESANYSGDFASLYVPYQYRQGNVYLTWAVSPRTDVSAGPFISRDAAKTGGAVTDGKGGRLAFNYKLTNTFSNSLELTGERDDVRLAQSSPTMRSTNFGATYAMTWTGQISTLQLSAGRTFSPNGAGGVYRTNQLQVEYDRKLSDRLSTSYAARYIDAGALAGLGLGDYKYGEGVASLKWLVTRTWYLGGGAEFVWVRYGANSSSADNAMAYVSFGYLGLGRRP